MGKKDMATYCFFRENGLRSTKICHFFIFFDAFCWNVKKERPPNKCSQRSTNAVVKCQCSYSVNYTFERKYLVALIAHKHGKNNTENIFNSKEMAFKFQAREFSNLVLAPFLPNISTPIRSISQIKCG